ncbi:NAD(P)/FAD-dependent oxidoreductase [Streptomyces sp. NPDC020917]|uniref:NAD(P)/FAD-dependent oxidoreductase n=1 Tax=Streptomyces sp. NPDC020917 TaxID=3365102 RepID=UPI00378C5D58
MVVVGGGPAGLSAGLTLARARRSVLVVDAGRPRNAPAEAIHGFLGRDGVPPAELLAAGRAEVRAYGGEVIEGTVVSLAAREGRGAGGGARADGGPDREDREDGNTAGFDVVLADGSRVRADRLVVTTGLSDELPDVPGLAERFGRDVLHCPYCHGWEVRDQPIGVLATGPLAVHQALLWRQWSSDVALFLHAGPEPVEPSDEEYEQLAARGIAVVDGAVAGLAVDGDRLTGVVLAGGRTLPVRALVVTARVRANAEVLRALGLDAAELEMGGHPVGTAVAADAMTGATSVPGVWVAGNVTSPPDQVVSAAAAGVRAAAAANADLVARDVRRAVAARNAPFSAEMERQAAERVLGVRRHGV